MKPQYTPDNTRSSIAVITLLAAGVTIVALLIGLSDKPDVQAIGVGVSQQGAQITSAAGTLATDEAGTALPSLGDSNAVTVDGTTDGTTAERTDAGATTPTFGDTSDGATGDTTATGDPAAGAATDAAPPAPTPTPEIAAAVEPAAPATTEENAELDAALGATSRVPTGTIGGSFFVSADEEAGATVNRNELTVTLADDGTGSFAGVLEISRADRTEITLSMSGQFLWSSSADPQVEADLSGTYAQNSPDDTLDINSSEGKLTISSLLSGVGSLCADSATGNCFGFTFATNDGF